MKTLPRMPASRLAWRSFSSLPIARREVATIAEFTRTTAGLRPSSVSRPLATAARTMHSATSRSAKVAPMVGTGPPPLPPLSEGMAIRRMRDTKEKTLGPQRWWNGVLVKEEDGTCSALSASNYFLLARSPLLMHLCARGSYQGRIGP
jgi:hypothetical protein